MSKEWLIDDKLQKAAAFATQQHGNQARKGTSIPYIVHPMSVCKTLIRHGAGVDLATAGVLHDVVEDTPATRQMVAELFGERVADLVEHASEPDKDADWLTRKEHTVQAVNACNDVELLALKCADKLDNLCDIRFDFSLLGDELWNRFNTPNGVTDQKWYYGTLADCFSDKLKGTQWQRMSESLQDQVSAVFG
jgi:(p)ppGpp synthase/HD superfamily hydrolase